MQQNKISSNFTAILLQKPYELRTPQQHNSLSQFFTSNIPDCEVEMAKKLSFYAIIHRTFSEETAINLNIGTIILENDNVNPELYHYYRTQSKQFRLNAHNGLLTIIIDGKDVQKCVVTKKSSIEQEIKFFQSCQYFDEMPKKRIYYALKNCEILKFSFGQRPYFEGQQIRPGQAGSGIFLVRQGEFSFAIKQRITNRAIDIYTFGEKYIFGSEEEKQQSKVTEGSGTPIIFKNHRLYSVICKSSEAIVYRFSEDFFNSFMRKFCDHLLQANKAKLKDFFDKNILKIEKNRQENNFLLAQTIKRSYSTEIRFGQKKEKTSTGFQSVELTRSKFEKKKLVNPQSQYSSMQPNRLKRDKLFSKIEIIKLTHQQHLEEKMIMQKKLKCLKMKELSKPSNTLTRGQILFDMLKTTWKFDKEKRKSMRK